MITRGRWSVLAALLSVAGLAYAEDAPPNNPQSAEQTAARVVHLGKSSGSKLIVGLETRSPTLVREIVRQAFLIAAREELQLATRDAWLGSELPAAGENAPFDLVYHYAGPANLEVRRGFGSQAEVVAKLPLEMPITLPYDVFLRNMEQASRTSFVETLVGAGFTRLEQSQASGGDASNVPAADKVSAHSPAELEKLVNSADLYSLFAAVRILHGVKGEKDETTRLGYLVRAYGQLGMLTELLWHPAHKVFKARALLYAQRMVALEPESAVGYEHRAFAFAASGLHSLALASLEKAGKLAQRPADAADASEALAPWTELIRAHCNFDSEALAKLESDPDSGSQARLLQFICLEQADCPNLTLEHGEHVLQAMPECYRVSAGMCNLAGVGLGHSITLAGPVVLAGSLKSRLRDLPGLPETTQGLLAAAGAGPGNPGSETDPIDWRLQAKLIESLLACGRAEQLPHKPASPKKSESAEKNNAIAETRSQALASDELAWETLGLLLREVSWLQIMARGHFLKDMLAVPAEEWIDSTQPVWDLHPYRARVAAFASVPAEYRKACDELAAINPEGIEIQASDLMKPLYSAHRAKAVEFARMAFMNSDPTMPELKRAIDWNGQQRGISYVWVLSAVAPHSPFAKAALVSYDYDKVKAKAVEWEKDAERFPTLAMAFGLRYASQGRFPEAERLMKTAAERSRASQAYLALAGIYQKQGKEEQWTATLEEYLKQPAYGLEHAQVGVTLAQHFMKKREYERARPYAETAAESYAAWALYAAARCNEALRNWERAEQYYAAIAQRYHGHNICWYFFCKRTGHGHSEDARRTALQYVVAIEDEADPIGWLLGQFYLLEKLPEDALKYFRIAAKQNDPYYLMHVAFLEDELKLFDERDATLKRIANEGREFKPAGTGRPRNEIIALAELIADDLAKKGTADFDFAVLDKIDGKDDPVALANLQYFLGRYLDRCGKSEAAIERWKKCMACPVVDVEVRTVAGEALVVHGIKPEQYENALLPAVAEKSDE